MPQRDGKVYAVLAFVIWGIFPLYFKWVDHLQPMVVLAGRIAFSCLLLLLLVLLLRQWSSLVSLAMQWRQNFRLFFTSLFIACNWGIYLWAVINDRIIEASLGYYINPLVNIFLGFIFLGERLRPVQWLALLLAATGVMIQVLAAAVIPWVALGLAFSFGFYTLLNKQVKANSMHALTLESLLLLPFALVFLFFTAWGATGHGAVGQGITSLVGTDWLLLALSGPVTVLPLLLFNTGAKTVSLTTLGFLQYIAPTLLVVLAVVIYDEPLTLVKMITFGFIWVALLLVSLDTLRSRQKKRVADYV